ncbi:hypothetical protein KTO58_07820 [Chitinophaga pendula]|nr:MULTISPECIES: hypothetical protein [Chitinophaga]UCJ09078.1 hypothetical protein KTO58_07820 [Chitinophaga pendula]
MKIFSPVHCSIWDPATPGPLYGEAGNRQLLDKMIGQLLKYAAPRMAASK